MPTQFRQVGDWLAERYEIFDIRFGGMGEIYIAYDHKGAASQRVLAIKALKDQYYQDPRFSDRFINECRTWIKLDRHPNVVRAYTVQIINGRPVVLLELVTGGSLRDWIGTPRLDLPTILRFGVQFCLGMEHSLGKGLHCHRDVKPENLLVTDGGSLKITDFGLAKIQDEGASAGGGGDAIPLSEPTVRQRIIHAGEDGDSFRDPTPHWSSIAASKRPAPLATPIPLGSNGQTALFAREQDVDHFGGGLMDQAEPREEEDSSSEWELDPNPTNTRPKAALGTGPYMAPEQFLDAKSVDFARTCMHSAW